MERTLDEEDEYKSKESYLSQMATAVKSLQNMEELTDLSMLINRVASLAKHPENNRFKTDLVDLGIYLNLPQISYDITVKLQALDEVNKSEDNDVVKNTLISLYDLNVILTDCSFEYGKQLHQTGFYKIIIAHLSKSDFFSNLDDNFVIQWDMIILGLLHNLLRIPGNSVPFRTESVKSTLTKGANLHDKQGFSMVCTLCLAYIVNENEHDLLEIGCHAIADILETMKYASLNRGSSPFSVEELLSALTVLTVNDSINKTFIQHDGLEILKNLCDPERPKEVQYITKIFWNMSFNDDNKKLFQEEAADMVNFLINLQDSLLNYLDEISGDSRRNIQGCLWLLCGELKPVRRSRPQRDVLPEVCGDFTPQAITYTTCPEFTEAASPMIMMSGPPPIAPMARSMHTARMIVVPRGPASPPPPPPPLPPPLPPKVFVSYCWSNKAEVMKVYYKLKGSGISCWLDTEQMKGSTLEAMAKGIEDASVILLCYSEAYRNSPNCRMEAEYAVTKQKIIIPLCMQYKYKPDGWLGIIIGTKLYYDFSGKKDFDSTFEPMHYTLVNHLNESDSSLNLKLPVKEDPITSTKEPATSSQPIKKESHQSDEKASSRTIKSEVLNWTCEDVSQWLRTHQLENVSNSFSKFNGRMLTRFLSLQHQSPEFFYWSLSEKLHLSLADILIFLDAVDATLVNSSTTK